MQPSTAAKALAQINSKEETELERGLFPTHKWEHGQPPARRTKGMSLRETEYKGKNRPVALPNAGHVLLLCVQKRINESTVPLVDAIFSEHQVTWSPSDVTTLGWVMSTFTELKHSNYFYLITSFCSMEDGTQGLTHTGKDPTTESCAQQQKTPSKARQQLALSSACFQSTDQVTEDTQEVSVTSLPFTECWGLGVGCIPFISALRGRGTWISVSPRSAWSS